MEIFDKWGKYGCHPFQKVKAGALGTNPRIQQSNSRFQRNQPRRQESKPR
jgi:hypothetical protein